MSHPRPPYQVKTDKIGKIRNRQEWPATARKRKKCPSSDHQPKELYRFLKIHLNREKNHAKSVARTSFLFKT